MYEKATMAPCSRSKASESWYQGGRKGFERQVPKPFPRPNRCSAGDPANLVKFDSKKRGDQKPKKSVREPSRIQDGQIKCSTSEEDGSGKEMIGERSEEGWGNQKRREEHVLGWGRTDEGGEETKSKEGVPPGKVRLGPIRNQWWKGKGKERKTRESDGSIKLCASPQT
ncbi:hypothetical protein IE53DRAFT_226469 [Violaceomyces palustris]|uniref:Uncharacterized protein n=1 Tax=Violaceomyces palustris TaxID=1673888 RepID=A0ACD0P4K9_9BASI|nr:hypothetical protein IE53DRAFT_226469 [Violaceomyces palustris]